MNDKSNKNYNWHDYSIELERSLLEQDSYIAYLKAKVAELEEVLNKCMLFTESMHYLDVDVTIKDSIFLNKAIKKLLQAKQLKGHGGE